MEDADKRKTEVFWRVLLAPVLFGGPASSVLSIHRGATAAFWMSVIVLAAVVFAVGIWRRYEWAVLFGAGMIFVAWLDQAWAFFR